MLRFTDLFEIEIKDILTCIKLLLQKRPADKSLLSCYVSEYLFYVTLTDYQKIKAMVGIVKYQIGYIRTPNFNLWNISFYFLKISIDAFSCDEQK